MTTPPQTGATQNGPTQVLRTGMVQLWHTLRPYYELMVRALRGDFTIHEPVHTKGKWLRNILNGLTILTAVFVGFIFFMEYQLNQTILATFIGLSVGAGVIFLARRPVLSWQLFLITSILTLTGYTYDLWPIWTSQVFILIAAVRLTTLTERPFRWIIPLTSASLVAIVNVVFFNQASWFLIIPVIALITYLIDNSRMHREVLSSKQAAEHAAVAASQMAAEAQTEIIALGNREAVLKERSHIARELHDVVAHHMSMVVVRAQTARYRLEDMPSAVTEELDEIADLARQSLNEVRELLSVLRSDGDVLLAPQPTLADLPDLISQAQDSGMELSCEIPEELPQTSTAVSIAAYRVIQEGLTNVRRHAPGAATDVFLLEQGTNLVITVQNGPPVAAQVLHPESLDLDETIKLTDATEPREIPKGHGLLGVEERVHAVGGSISAGATSDGGYLLYVRLPLDRQETFL